VANESLVIFGFLMQHICPIADAILDDARETVVMAYTECLNALEPYQMCQAVAGLLRSRA
jgi:hypothetical protein